MGPNIFTCKSSQTSANDYFQFQLAIYQWRADPQRNHFIAQAFFKNALTKIQQNAYQELLKQQQSSDYLAFFKLHTEKCFLPQQTNSEIITFEKYVFSLNEMKSSLCLPQILYTFYALLSGYEQISSHYSHLIVDARCCFVTRAGQIRTWINNNPKNNSLLDQQNNNDAQLSSKCLRRIIQSMIHICFDLASPSKQNTQFINTANHYLNNSLLQHISYSSTRKFINQYAYHNNVQISLNLYSALDNFKNSPIMTTRHTFQRKSQKSQTNNQPVIRKSNFSLHQLETAESQNKIRLKNSQMISHYKSSQKFAKQSLKTEPEDRPYPSVYSTIGLKSQVQYAESQLIDERRIDDSRKSSFAQKRQFTSPGKFSEIVVPNYRDLKNSNQNWGNLKSHAVRQSKENKNSTHYFTSVLNSYCQPDIIQNRNSAAKQKQNREKEEAKKYVKKVTTQSVKEGNKVQLQASIMNYIATQKQHSEESQVQRINKQHKTYIPKKTSIQTSQENIYWSRPWITTKTITRLISQRDSDKSLKQSIAESSDYYNESVYSGILTQMGRPAELKRTSKIQVQK